MTAEIHKDVTVRRRLFEVLEGSAASPVALIVRSGLALLIAVNIVAVTLESIAAVESEYHLWFDALLLISLVIFSLEYVARVWCAIEHPSGRFAKPVKGRLRYLFTPLGLLDLFAILPLLLGVVPGADTLMLRIFRLLWILKITHYLPAVLTIFRVFEHRWRVLAAALVIMISTLFIASTLMYLAEHEVQPAAFADIPSAMWWAMSTLTTVGYGDVVPISAAGRSIGMVIMMLGIAMFALPTAILASAFIEESKHNDFLVSLELVARVPLFKDLKTDEITRIVRLLKPRTLMPNEVIFQRDEIADSMYFILSGQVEIELISGAKTLRHGEFFGEIALVKQQNRTVTVVARTYTELLELDTQNFEVLLSLDDDMRRRIMTVAEKRLEESPR